MPETLTLITKPLSKNLSLEEQKSETRYVSLVDKNTQEIVHSEVYPQLGFYSISWDTRASFSKLVTQVEEFLTTYETEAEEQLPAVDGRKCDLFGLDLDKDDIFNEGIIITSLDQSNQVIDMEIPYLRPLSYSKFKELVQGNVIIRIRINTAIGDFFLIDEGSTNKFAFMSHLATDYGFAELVADTTDGRVDVNDSLLLLGTVISLAS
ncbi:MAG TPA: hypothetical protein VF209_03905 [Patescibacteria group bacterium]